MVRRLRIAVTAALVCFVVLGSRSSFSYQDEGHFDTTAAYLSHVYDGRVGPWIAFCAQLPDQTAEYDAITVEYQAETPCWKNCTADRNWRDQIQELLHALTGGSSGRMQECARKVLRAALSSATQPNAEVADWCAAGFAAHLLGDSFAHAKFADGLEVTDAGLLFETGLGHASEATEPDLPWYEGRSRGPLWHAWVSALSEAAPGVSFAETLGTQGEQFLVDKAMEGTHSLLRHRTDLDARMKPPLHLKIRQIAATENPMWMGADHLPEYSSGWVITTQDLHCGQYLQQVDADGGLGLPGLAEVATTADAFCDNVWLKYRAVAVPILTSSDCGIAFKPPNPSAGQFDTPKTSPE